MVVECLSEPHLYLNDGNAINEKIPERHIGLKVPHHYLAEVDKT